MDTTREPARRPRSPRARQQTEDAVAPDVDLVRRAARRELPGHARAAARRRRADHRALHACSRSRRRRATSSRSTAAATRSPASSRRPSPIRRPAGPRSPSPPKPAASDREKPRTSTTLHDDAADVRRSRARSLPDRAQGGDQREADRGRAAAACDAAVRLRPRAAPDRLLRLDVPARRSRAAGCMGGGLMGIGKSKARRYDQETDAKVTFDDVAGIDEAENELVEIVDFLQDPGEVHAPGRHRAQGRAAGRRAGHGQDAARARGGRRGGRAVLLDERRGVRGDDRGRGRGARARPVQAGARARAGDHLHRRARRDRPRARTGGDRRHRASRSRR